MRQIHKFYCLPHREKILFLRALLLLVHSRFSIQFKQFKNVVRHFSRKAASQQSAKANSISSSRVAALLNAASRFIPAPTCSSKILAGPVLFKSCGYQTQLHIGITREEGCMLEAHAWLTLDGSVIVSDRSDLGRYHELPFVFDCEMNKPFSKQVGCQKNKVDSN